MWVGRADGDNPVDFVRQDRHDGLLLFEHIVLVIGLGDVAVDVVEHSLHVSPWSAGTTSDGRRSSSKIVRSEVSQSQEFPDPYPVRNRAVLTLLSFLSVERLGEGVAPDRDVAVSHAEGGSHHLGLVI